MCDTSLRGIHSITKQSIYQNGLPRRSYTTTCNDSYTSRILVTIILSLSILLHSCNTDASGLADKIKSEEAGEIQDKPAKRPKLSDFLSNKKVKRELKNQTNGPVINNNGRFKLNNSNPEVVKLYEGLAEKIKGLKERQKKQESKEDKENYENERNGIDLALKQLAAEFEKQVLTLMWQFASSGVTSGHGFSNDVWNSQRNDSIIEAGYGDLGEIGEAVYEELRRNVLGQDIEITNDSKKRKYSSAGFAKEASVLNETNKEAIAKGK